MHDWAGLERAAFADLERARDAEAIRVARRHLPQRGVARSREVVSMDEPVARTRLGRKQLSL